MDKSSLLTKLEELKQKSEDTINQITEHENLVQTLREEALIIKGRYHALEELIAEWTDEAKVIKGKIVRKVG